MLTFRSVDKMPSPSSGVCPMPALCGSNFITQLHSRSTAFDEHVGPLSVKCVFNGQERYEVGRGRLLVTEECYLLLNNGQRYASSIQSENPVDSFCVWFGSDFVSRVPACLESTTTQLLDDPECRVRQPVEFFERLYPHDECVSTLLVQLRAALNQEIGTRGWLEEQFHLLFAALLQKHHAVLLETESLPALRRSTRLELYRRLYRARDFLDASLETPASLEETASIACLSPHHFLRVFKEVFRETPHQYLGRKRLARACELLTKTEQSVTQICFDLGFESLGSFSWLFRRRFGVSPKQYRQYVRKEPVPFSACPKRP